MSIWVCIFFLKIITTNLNQILIALKVVVCGGVYNQLDGSISLASLFTTSFTN